MNRRARFRVLIASDEKKDIKTKANEYYAEFNLYSTMAHYVGKVLHIRPNEILDTWGVSELIVAYGEYANEVSQDNYENWRHMDAASRGEPPEKYVVKFLSDDRLEET